MITVLVKHNLYTSTLMMIIIIFLTESYLRNWNNTKWRISNFKKNKQFKLKNAYSYLWVLCICWPCLVVGSVLQSFSTFLSLSLSFSTVFNSVLQPRIGSSCLWVFWRLGTFNQPLHFLSHSSTHVIVTHVIMLSRWCIFMVSSLWVPLTFHCLCTLLERPYVLI